MPHSQTFDVLTLLREHLYTQVKGKSYDTLRKWCLDRTNIESIIAKFKHAYQDEALIATIEENAHRQFLLALEDWLNDNRVDDRIDNRQQATLFQIITQMRQHLDDKATLLVLEKTYLASTSTLSECKHTLDAITASQNNIQQTIVSLERTNASLQLNYHQLKGAHSDKIIYRNEIAFYALYATSLSALGLAGAYLCQATFLITITPASVFLLGGVLGLVMTTLLITAAILSIQALLIQSKIDETNKAITSNTAQLQAETTKYNDLNREQIEPIKNNSIQSLEKICLTLSGSVEQARAAAAQSLKKATAMTDTPPILVYQPYRPSFFPEIPDNLKSTEASSDVLQAGLVANGS